MNTASISMPILGIRPYVLIQVASVEDGKADVTLTAGGVDTTSAEELKALARVTADGARGLRRQARAVAKREKAAAKEVAA